MKSMRETYLFLWEKIDRLSVNCLAQNKNTPLTIK